MRPAIDTDNPPAILEQLAICVEAGKASADTDIPRGSQGQPGVREWLAHGLAHDLPPGQLLHEGLSVGMQRIGERFAAAEVFIPEVLIAARAMQTGISVLRPLFVAGELPSRGVFVIGSVLGDLHDIGKNLVAVMLEGAGWRVVDLGVDCDPGRFIEAIAGYPGCAVGLSALLTTTMNSMRGTLQTIREAYPEAVVLVGGAPVTQRFADEIGASGYAADPSAAIRLLDQLMPREAA